MHNKKGSMELGVNSIVILIIALAVLGISISFIVNLINQASSKLGKVIDNTEISNPATNSDPLTFESNQITIRRGKSVQVKASVYNTMSYDDSFSIDVQGSLTSNTPTAACTFAEDAAYADVPIRVSQVTQQIKSGSNGAYQLVINALASTGTGTSAVTVDPGTYICTFEAFGTDPNTGTIATKQLIIELTP